MIPQIIHPNLHHHARSVFKNQIENVIQKQREIKQQTKQIQRKKKVKVLKNISKQSNENQQPVINSQDCENIFEVLNQYNKKVNLPKDDLNKVIKYKVLGDPYTILMHSKEDKDYQLDFEKKNQMIESISNQLIKQSIKPVVHSQLQASIRPHTSEKKIISKRDAIGIYDHALSKSKIRPESKSILKDTQQEKQQKQDQIFQKRVINYLILISRLNSGIIRIKLPVIKQKDHKVKNRQQEPLSSINKDYSFKMFYKYAALPNKCKKLRQLWGGFLERVIKK